ncbi:glycosyltransferase family 2 protein [Arthrobacter sp. 92]|uniref:glycosyltransferase family 2 protein n=1 Tax=Arthrobacter sp. 92 TaxID=3418175 RepID=UPI003D042E91
MNSTVAAVVVAFKNGNDLAECYIRLCAIAEIRHIVIVDNSYWEVGSCLTYAGINAIDVRTIHAVPDGNLGYAGGNNFGIDVAKRAGAECVLVCNPDVLIEAETVTSLLSEMETRSLDLISPRLLENDPIGGVTLLSNPGWDAYLGKGVIDIPASRFASRYIPTFYGACFLATTRLWDHLGGLSEDFFLYGEEIDYTMRINRSSFRWAVSECSVVAHARGSSISPGRNGKSLVAFFHAARSAVIVGRKYWPAAVVWWTAVRLVFAGYLALRRRPSESRAVVRGLMQGVRSPLTS